MSLIIESQYFPCITSCITLFKNKNIDFCIYDPYLKMSFRNRCIIATANGTHSLSIPILGGRSHRAPFRDIRIDHSGTWRDKHWRSVFSAYGKAPMFFQYGGQLEDLYRKRIDFLMDWNMACLEWVNGIFGITLSYPDPVSGAGSDRLDWRDRIRPKNYQDAEFGPFPVYPQVFQEKIGFQPNLSILDLIFCMGKQGRTLLIT